MLRWLTGQSWADTERVAAAGWSHGAWSIMEAMVAAAAGDAVDHPGIAKLRLAALFYPYAGPLAHTRAEGWGRLTPKVFACLAGRDAVVGRVGPRRALDRLAADGLDVCVLDLAEATHCFDDAHTDDPWTHYRPDLAVEARAAYAQALVLNLCAQTSAPTAPQTGRRVSRHATAAERCARSGLTPFDAGE